ncbi:diaminopimelate epimerase [Alphaproteobacteria bacterium]|nr:diaminopimelate epimerase [Alphaproteobacteria bacterium]
MSAGFSRPLPFIKMHGLGNDFIILDARDGKHLPDTDGMRLLANRHTGIGCDQIMILQTSATGADVRLDILNADGSVAGACGNGTRCVADIIMHEMHKSDITIETISGTLSAWHHRREGDVPLISVDMGMVRTGWRDIPLAEAANTAELELGPVAPDKATCQSVGNPHAVMFVDDVAAIDLLDIGPQLEHHPLFPDRANIEIVTVLGQNKLRMRVWERGAGITMACGSGACAAAVAAIRRGLTALEDVEVVLDAGSLFITWQAGEGRNGHVIMTGPTTHVAAGIIDPTLFGSDFSIDGDG